MATPKTIVDYGSITAIPTTFIIDRQGNIVTAFQGFTDRATFESAISPLLAVVTTPFTSMLSLTTRSNCRLLFGGGQYAMKQRWCKPGAKRFS
jgi:hypothetical protein